MRFETCVGKFRLCSCDFLLIPISKTQQTMTDFSTQLNPQQHAQCQHCQCQFPSAFLKPKYWFGQLVEHTYTDDETGTIHRSIGVVVGLTLHLPGWNLPGWVYFVKFFWSGSNTPQLPCIDEVSETELQLVLFS